MTIEHLYGLIAAPFTPMREDGKLNPSLIPAYCEMLKANGVAGAFICGSTGEGVSLTADEKKVVAEAWVAAKNGDTRFKLITLLGGTSVQECVELAQHARQAGIDAVAITSPFYFKPTSVAALAEVCATVARAIPDMPVYYYHIPVLTGVGFPMIDLLREVHGVIPNFAGIKYTHEDFMDFLSCLNFQDGRYDMLWGRDETLLSALVLGAKGGVGSTYNYAAPLYRELMAAYDDGNLLLARKRQQQAIDMISLLGKYGGIATGKAYMKVIGLDCGEFRLPVKNMSPAQFDSFRHDVERLNFRSYCSKVSSSSRALL